MPLPLHERKQALFPLQDAPVNLAGSFCLGHGLIEPSLEPCGVQGHGRLPCPLQVRGYSLRVGVYVLLQFYQFFFYVNALAFLSDKILHESQLLRRQLTQVQPVHTPEPGGIKAL